MITNPSGRKGDPEKRKHQRLPVRTRVFVSGNSFSRFRSYTLDFSDGGLFIEGTELASLPIDTVIQVQSAEGLAEPPLLNARIAWTNRLGAGIEYLAD